MFDIWIRIITKIISVLASAVAIVGFIIGKEKKRFIILLFVFLVVGFVSYFPAKIKYKNEKPTEDKSESPNMTEYILQDSTTEDNFVSDYTPGSEKIIENSTYINNYGCLSIQDKKMYISTQNGLLKMNTDKTNVENVLDVNAYNLNVLGDWIYYTTQDGIYKVRTDGKYNQKIIEVTQGVKKMIIHENGIYFINREDMKLYFMCVDGTKIQRVLEDHVIAFCFSFSGMLIYTTAEPLYDTQGNKSGYRTQSLYAMDTDKNVTLIMTYEMGEMGATNEAPVDLCAYDMDIIYCNYFGLFRVDGVDFSITKLSDIGGVSLCVQNGRAYYSGDLPTSSGPAMSMGNIICVDLQSENVSILGKPFDENASLIYLYPVDDNIIISNNRLAWYVYTNGELEPLLNMNGYNQ